MHAVGIVTSPAHQPVFGVAPVLKAVILQIDAVIGIAVHRGIQPEMDGLLFVGARAQIEAGIGVKAAFVIRPGLEVDGIGIGMAVDI